MSVDTTEQPFVFTPTTRESIAPQGMVMIVGDDLSWGQNLDLICDFFGIAVEHVPSELDVGYLLREFRPMAVIAEADARGQDGFNVMLEVARHDPDLPMMLLTGQDPALLGAAEAMREVTGLTRLIAVPELPVLGDVIDFLFRAGRAAGIGRMMPVGQQVGQQMGRQVGQQVAQPMAAVAE